jgi:hypothetical protein
VLVVCIILYDSTCTEFENPCDYHESAGSSEISQGIGEYCFEGAAILLDGYVPQIPRRDRHKSLQI